VTKKLSVSLCVFVRQIDWTRYLNISYKTNADSIEESMSIANHKIGLEKIAALLMDRKV
jgi:hypothetical protein